MILGPSGRGKSTLAASFHVAGSELLGDDAAIVTWLDAVPSSRSLYKSLRLLPDSIDALLPLSTESEEVSELSWKRRVKFPDGGSSPIQPLPIAAVFYLDPPESNSAVEIRPMTVRESCMVLVENAFACNPADTGQAKGRLEQASKLAKSVPCFAISYPREYHFLPTVRAAMLDQVTG